MSNKTEKDEIRQLAEADLYTFARLVNPHRVYGDVHRELFEWWTRKDALDNQLVLLPRDHQKSHCIAVRAAHALTVNPASTILYVSATSPLAEKQLYAIKNILTSDVYRRYWPDMVERHEGKRELWNVREISVDHPTRKSEGVRDSSVFAAGLTTNITGFHANIVILDDMVVPNNAYSEEGRETVRRLYSQLASIETTGAKEWVVGTRYHPDDIYSSLKEMKEDIMDEEGEPIDEQHVYEVFERVVETDGEFLWPKETRDDGVAFGFNHKELARKKAKYIDKTQFYAQYYNDPNDPESHRLDRSRFQYYNPEHLVNERGVWKFKDKRLNIFAAADLAYTIGKGADYTALVIVGIDSDGFIYVLDLIRFQTNKYDEYYDRIVELHKKWHFRKIRIETNAGGSLVAGYIRDRMRREGIGFSIDEKPATRREGSKEERIAATLEPRYEELTIWHFKGGMINVLENELVLSRPKNDDLKDALAMAVSIATPPAKRRNKQSDKVVEFNPRFGGIMR